MISTDLVVPLVDPEWSLTATDPAVTRRATEYVRWVVLGLVLVQTPPPYMEWGLAI